MKHVLFFLIALCGIASAEEKYNFINHDKINSIDYKIFIYNEKNFYVPVINGFLPEISFKRKNSNETEITFDYQKKIKYDSTKLFYELENKPIKNDKQKNIEEKKDDKYIDLNKKLLEIQKNIENLNAFVAALQIEVNIENATHESEIYKIQESLIELKNKITKLENDKKINQTENKSKEDNKIDIQKKTTLETQKENFKPLSIEKGLKKPSEIIK